MIHFTPESPTDIAAREALLDRVMGPERLLKPSEHLRAGRIPARGLSLVARDGGELVGTVRLWNIAAAGRPALLLGPLCVDPDACGKGVGAGLMKMAVARSRMLGHSGIVLVGDPEYYERFGFDAAATGGLVMPAPVERRRFLGLELSDGALAKAGGRIIATGEPVEGLRVAA
jgi:predicted N-acetyltransferase YhbS